MASAETVSIRLFIRPANFCTKWRTSGAMSSGRSRNGGIVTGKTFNR